MANWFVVNYQIKYNFGIVTFCTLILDSLLALMFGFPDYRITWLKIPKQGCIPLSAYPY